MDEALLRLARQQHGLLTTQQIEAAGHRNLARGRMASGEWVEEQPGVLRPAISGPDFAGRVAAVRLSLAASTTGKEWAFSHTTAARLRRFVVPASDDIQVWLPRSRPAEGLRSVVRHVGGEPKPGAFVHKEPVTSLVTTVLQSASVLGADELSSLLEDLLRREQTSVAVLRGELGRGRVGSRSLRSALEVLDSEGLDRWMRFLAGKLVAGGLPSPLLEHPVHENGRLLARFDGCYDEAKLGLEVDDWLTHGLRGASERDRQRDAHLQGRFGITTLRTTPRQLRTNPAPFVQNVKLTYERLLAAQTRLRLAS